MDSKFTQLANVQALTLSLAQYLCQPHTKKKSQLTTGTKRKGNRKTVEEKKENKYIQ